MPRKTLRDVSINLQSPKQHFRVHEKAKATNFEDPFAMPGQTVASNEGTVFSDNDGSGEGKRHKNANAEAGLNATSLATQRRARLRLHQQLHAEQARRTKIRTRKTTKEIEETVVQDEIDASPESASPTRISSPSPIRTQHRVFESDLAHKWSPDYDYDKLWEQIREQKQQQHQTYPKRLMEMKDDASSIASQQTNTTTVQPDKQSRLYGEQMLHPRWIALQEKKTNLRLATFEKYLCILDTGLEMKIAEIIEPLLVQLNGQDQDRIEDQIKYLQSSKAIESQWENNLWRRFFFKLSYLSPMHPNVPPCGHQIAQARMTFNNECALPPLLATRDARRKSRIIISETPWDPDLEKSSKDGTILWYPDYLYAVSLSALHLDSIDSLPGIRLAQHECAPAYLLIETKSSIEKEFAAKQYMAFLGAYTLHERLLLRLAACASPTTLDSTSTSLDVDHSLSLYVMTCCGPVCKIWNMHVREMPQKNKTAFEPIRYDLELLEEIDIQDRRKHAKLAQWINNIHTFGSTKHLDALCNDAAKAQKLQGSNTMDWTREYAFVYDYSLTGGNGRKIRPVRKAEMQIAYEREEFAPEEPVAREVVDFVEGGRMALVASRARRRVGDGKGPAIKHASGQKHDLLSPPLSEDGEISTSFSTSSAMVDEPVDLAIAHSPAIFGSLRLAGEKNISPTLDVDAMLPLSAAPPGSEPTRSNRRERRAKGK